MFLRLFVYFFLLFIITTQSLAKPLHINEKTDEIKLLPHSTLFIDTDKNTTIEDILSSDKFIFEKIEDQTLSFGYAPQFDVWVKFTLLNTSTKTVTKIINYANPLTTHVEFYDPDTKYKPQREGLFYPKNNENILSSSFKVELAPQQSKSYYLKASSHITTLIVDLNLFSTETFYTNEITHQVILALFFGAMVILGVYNLFIFFFTKDISYLFYVLYITGLVIHHIFYVGIASTYFFSSETVRVMTEFASLIVAFPILALGFFTKYFLHTKQYKIHNNILNFFLVFIPITILFFLVTNAYDQYRNIFTMFLLIYLLYLTIYASVKKNKQAYFILFGWFVFVLTGLLMYLSSLGIFSIHDHFAYLIELSFLLEAIIFSIALANKINSLQKEKNQINEKLIQQEKEETYRLEKKVAEKTKDLQIAYDEKDTLLKELNHRVKNNMQTIISLIRLQIDEIEDERLESYLKTIQNRISAMSHLHELLYKQTNFSKIDTFEYFSIITKELNESYGDDIAIDLQIETDLKIEEGIYCGLILNELITNSIKYAFNDRLKGMIIVSLSQHKAHFILEVKDNGIGYDTKKTYTSLGLTLVETLATIQLDGTFRVECNDGTKSTIEWGNDAED